MMLSLRLLVWWLLPRSFFALQTQTLFHVSRIPAQRASSHLLSHATTHTITDLEKVPQDFRRLFHAAVNATALRGADTSNQGHDSFRYEWGTWVVEESLQYLMEQVDTVRLQPGAYEHLLQKHDNTGGDGVTRYQLAAGEDWDCILYVLPEKSQHTIRHVTGAWSILKAITGVAETYAVSEQRDGSLRKRGSVRQLRGGTSDGSLGSGGEAGQDCVKYVGGPLRCYEGSVGKTTLLEVTIRPPIGKNADILENLDELPLDMDEVLRIVEHVEVPEKEEAESHAVADAATTLANLNSNMGISFDQVGGLDAQLNDIARRVLASRANPAAARRLGVSHVRGILLSGPPGCGKTLLARELAVILGARQPQIVNGPEILDKYIGEAEKNVRELFRPAEIEYAVSGDDSALHIIILDEMDAIARKRGSMSSDTTGVRDSVVNQLLSKMDGVKQASNVLVVGLTNRPELLDPALLRPGRLEVQLRVELPDLTGRRDILRIHTRAMRAAGGVSADALDLIENVGDSGLAAQTDYFTGAELAGLVRSAASFALARAFDETETAEHGQVTIADFKQALREVRPALGKQDDVLKSRFPHGISLCSTSMKRVCRHLHRFTSQRNIECPSVQSVLVAGACGSVGTTAVSAWAASEASINGGFDYVRFITAMDLTAGDEARAAGLIERFAEAKEMSHSLLVLDDIDLICAGNGPLGYSTVMVATLRALLRSPPSRVSGTKTGRTLRVIGTTSRSDTSFDFLLGVFEETIVVPMLQDVKEVETVLEDCLTNVVKQPADLATLLIGHFGKVGCKTVLRLANQAVVIAEDEHKHGNTEISHVQALANLLDDLYGNGVITTERMVA